MIEAWLSRSPKITSSRPASAASAPTLVWKPVPEVMHASLRRKRARRSSSSSCSVSVPFKKRDPVQPEP
jgi:hypothetical protein